jgi:hypothetical protein
MVLMSRHVHSRDAELDTTQIRVYVKDKKRLDRIAHLAWQASGQLRYPSYPMLVRQLLDGKEETP